MFFVFFQQVGCMTGSDVMEKWRDVFFFFSNLVGHPVSFQAFRGKNLIRGILPEKHFARFAAPWAGVHVKVLVDI